MAPPGAPMETLTMPAGLPCQALSPYGREPQSRAFFRTPGIERLYSGVKNSTPSLSRTCCLRRRTGSGSLPSSSWSYRGRSPMRTSSKLQPSGASRIIASASLRLKDSLRRLPMSRALVRLSMCVLLLWPGRRGRPDGSAPRGDPGEAGEDLVDRAVRGRGAFGRRLLRDAADRGARPQQVVAFGVDEVDAQGAFAVVADPRLVVPDRDRHVGARPVVVVVVHVAARRGVDVGALADEPLEVHPQVRGGLVVAVPARVHLGPDGRLHRVGEIGRVPGLLHRDRFVEGVGAVPG